MKRTPSGFTLVTLAIALVIFGLISGMILKGQEILAQGRIKSVAAQMQRYQSAMTQFRSKYKALPGDMEDATTRLANCTAASFCQDGDGDRMIGEFFDGVGAYPYTGATASIDVIGAGVDKETRQFWRHLLAAQMLEGEVGSNGQTGWGVSQPAARVGGGYEVFFNASAPAPGGHWLLLRNQISTESPFADVVIRDVRALSEEQAVVIDRMIDDGIPDRGAVQAGPGVLCAGGGSYNLQNTSKDCNLFFRLDRF